MSKDNALEALLNINKGLDDPLPEDLVKKCYYVEKRFQYDEDRQVAVNELRHIVEDEVERRMASTAEAGGE